MQSVNLILQARMSSSRLPGKMLLPIGGLPLVVLCAKRASRGNAYPIVVATSNDPSDDEMIPALNEHGINYVRGPLDDVLGRFILAAEDMNDSDLIVRLTGDNPVVDSDFIQLVLDEHKRQEKSYTRSLSPFDGLPYGVSAEVIEAGLLRDLHKNGATVYEREHVTIHHTLKDDYHLYTSPSDKDLSHLRATVDTKEDYDRAVKLFDDETDPIGVTWTKLVDKLRVGKPASRTPYKRNGLKAQSIFALGTVQLGLSYGIANKTGRPDTETSKEILETAIAHGVTFIDTAAAYGESEKVIGQSLSAGQKQDVTITTKLDPLNNADNLVGAAKQSVEKSLRDLGLSSLPVFMLHRWSHYKTPVWPFLLELQKQGTIQSLGMSAQNPDEALEALNIPEIKFIQLPFNICDWRWRESGFIDARAKRPDIHVQVRSSLLQGMLLLPPEQWPADLKQSQETSKTLQQAIINHNRKSMQDLCYAYARSQDWVDSVVVGVETKEQLLENLQLFSEPLLNDASNIIIPRMDETFLNPALWPKR